MILGQKYLEIGEIVDRVHLLKSRLNKFESYNFLENFPFEKELGILRLYEKDSERSAFSR